MILRVINEPFWPESTTVPGTDSTVFPSFSCYFTECCNSSVRAGGRKLDLYCTTTGLYVQYGTVAIRNKYFSHFRQTSYRIPAPSDLLRTILRCIIAYLVTTGITSTNVLHNCSHTVAWKYCRVRCFLTMFETRVFTVGKGSRSKQPQIRT